LDLIGTEIHTETAFLITPDRKVKPINEVKIMTFIEKREVTLPGGKTLSGNVQVTRRQVGWSESNSVAATEAEHRAACMQSVMDKLVDVFPDYFRPSLVKLLSPQDAAKIVSTDVSDATITFLANTRMEMSKPTFRVLDTSVVQLRLFPPFLLNDLSAALKGTLSIVPPYLDSLIKISAELVWSDARVQQLSPVEQDLRAYPPTEWFWSVEPLKSGNANVFVKFTIVRERGAFQKGIPFLYPTQYAVEGNFIKSTIVFVSDNWQWISGTIFIPLAIYLFHIFGFPKIRSAPEMEKTGRGNRKKTGR
jgi:hypothetical protein